CGFFVLGHLCRRQPSLLQRGILAEQRFLQRPSHTLSLRTLKLLTPPAQPSIPAAASQTPGVTRTPWPVAQSNRTLNSTPARSSALPGASCGGPDQIRTGDLVLDRDA